MLRTDAEVRNRTAVRNRRTRWALTVGLLAILSLPSTGCIVMCYEGTSKGFNKIEGVWLDDGLNTGSYDLTKLQNVCAPMTSGFGIDASDPNLPYTYLFNADAHLSWYELDLDEGTKNRTSIPVSSLLGDYTVQVRESSHLLVPAAKSLTGDPSPLDPNSHLLDHYHCYGARTDPRGADAEETLGDQFTDPPQEFEIDYAEHLCLPVSKNYEPVKLPDVALLCFDVDGPKHKKVKNIRLLDQFGPHRFETKKRNELCVPALLCPDGFGQCPDPGSILDPNNPT
jgi:hypothetical protein